MGANNSTTKRYWRLSWKNIKYDNEEQIDYYLELLEEEVNNNIFDRLEEIKKVIKFPMSIEQLIQPGYILFVKAKIYHFGIDVEQNYEKAIELYEQSIKLGNTQSMIKLAHMYKNGKEVEQNYEKAVELYEQAIQLGNSKAMNNLAIMYKNGLGVQQNTQKAIKLYEQAIQLGNSKAMNNLAIMYKFDYYVLLNNINYLKVFLKMNNFNFHKMEILTETYQIITQYNTKLFEFQLLNYNKIKFQNFKNKFIYSGKKSK